MLISSTDIRTADILCLGGGGGGGSIKIMDVSLTLMHNHAEYLNA